MRRLTMVAALSALLLPLLVGVTAGSAQAFDDGGDESTQYGRAGDCFASAGPNYLGLRCLTGATGDDGPKPPYYYLCNDGKPPQPLKPGETKPGNCEQVPQCWNAALTSEEQQTLGLVNTEGPPKVTYYWIRCLHGISKDYKVTGSVSVAQGPIAKGVNDTVVEPSVKQTQLLEAYVGDGSRNGRIPPQPLVVASPSTRPRVNTDISFFDSNLTGSTLTVSSGSGVQLQAREVTMEINPLGRTGDERTTPSTCKRQSGSETDPKVRVGYEAKVGETPQNTPNGCWYRYKKSSAAATNNVWQAFTTAHWEVYQKVGNGPWEQFRNLNGDVVEFDKESFTPIFVFEVQSINYLPLTGASR